MPAKQKNLKKSSPAADKPAGSTMALALTLVPMVIGLLLIGAWALDIQLVGTLENQALLGLLIILAGFTASNLLQRKWLAFAGWALITVADFLLLAVVDLRVQSAALALAVIGGICLLAEMARRLKAQSPRA